MGAAMAEASTGLWGLPLTAAQALYLFSPLLVSATLAALVMRRGWLSALNRPIDGGATLRGHRWLGDGKTWRGALLALTGASLAVLVQQAVAGHVPDALQVIDYSRVDALAFGGALGIGAILGELPNSFVKRRLGIPRGITTRGPLAALFYVWDQVDAVIGAWPLLCLWFEPPLALVVMSFAVALAVHPLVAWIGYRVGARKTAR
jgi:CDP-2,3-bis-(O-geranylgeranyl)-sn-glycerol synthase